MVFNLDEIIMLTKPHLFKAVNEDDIMLRMKMEKEEIEERKFPVKGTHFYFELLHIDLIHL